MPIGGNDMHGHVARTAEARHDVFEGKPDARQSPDVGHPVSRFRPTYWVLNDEEKALHDLIKQQAVALEESFNRLNKSRYYSLAMTSLEESVMWAVKQLTS